MFNLSFDEKIYILAASFGIVLATLIIMACRLIPNCWLYHYCTKRTKETEGKFTDAIYPEKPLLPTLKTTAVNSRSRADSCNSTVMSDMDGFFKPTPTTVTINGGYGSASSTTKSPMLQRNGRPDRLTISTTSVSELSSKETSPSHASKTVSKFALPSSDPNSHQGILHLRVQYIRPEEKLTLWLDCIDQLPPSVYGTANDCFVKVIVIKDARRRWRRKSSLSVEEAVKDMGYEVNEFRSKTIRRTLSPKFNEQFTVELLDRDRKYTQVKLLAYAEQRGSQPVLVGESHFSLSKLQLHRVAHNAEEWHDIRLELGKFEENKGELFLAIAYLPTSQRLVLSNLKAVDLVTSDKNNSADTYVKASLLFRGKALEKHRTETIIDKTSPVFPETINFDVPASDLGSVTLLVSVMQDDSPMTRDDASDDTISSGSGEHASATLNGHHDDRRNSDSTAELSPKPYTNDRRKSADAMSGCRVNNAESQSNKKSPNSSPGHKTSRLIGRVAFSCFVNGTAREHWQEVIANPRKQIAQWHKLRQ